jgi:YYY domain-containing protein
MPFCFLFFSLLAVFVFRSSEMRERFSWKDWRLHGFFFSLVLGSAYMFHTWDYPGYILLTLITLMVMVYQQRKEGISWRFAAWVIFLIGVSYFLFLPFRLAFEQAAGVKVSLVDADKRSPLAGFLTVNGLSCFVLFSFLLTVLCGKIREGALPVKGAVCAVLSVVVFAVALIATGSVVLALTALVSLWALIALMGREDDRGRLIVLICALFCAGIFLGCELFYIKDFYGERLQRQNTVFKFYFQAWIVSSVIFSAGSLFVMNALRRWGKVVWGSALFFLVGVSLIYPLWGTYHRCERFRTGPHAPKPYLPTLNGMAFIKQQHAGDYKALQWVADNIAQEDVVLEATGAPFSFFGRVSAFTGRPTVLGWGNHESLWRDWSWKRTMERTNDVKKIYEEERKSSVQPLLDKYEVRYVYVGPLEKKQYPLKGLRGFNKSFPVVYRDNTVAVYEVPRGGLP